MYDKLSTKNWIENRSSPYLVLIIGNMVVDSLSEDIGAPIAYTIGVE